MTHLLKIVFGFSISFFLFSSLFSKDNPSQLEMTLHDFMEDYTRPASKHLKKTGDADPLLKILASVPEMAPTEDKVRWKEIIDEKLALGKPEDTCKACHTEFKKDYKSQYRKRLIPIPKEIEVLQQLLSKSKSKD